MHLIDAVGLPAGGAAKVHVVVVVLVLGTSLFAQGIFHGTAAIVDAVQQALLFKRVQRAVERHAIVLAAKLLFDGSMGQSVLVLQKQVQHIGAAPGLAQAVSVYDLVKFVHAGQSQVRFVLN